MRTWITFVLSACVLLLGVPPATAQDAAMRVAGRVDCLQQPQPDRWADASTPDRGSADAVVSAHRGANHLAPENILAAFRHAFAYGAEMVEADVRTTADGMFVVLHDQTVDRTTDGEGAVADLTYAEVRALNAAAFGQWQGSAYDPARIPTLEEIVALAAEVGRGVEFDIKDADALAVADLAARYGILGASAFNKPDPRVTQRYPQARLIYNRDAFEPPASLYALAASDTYGVFGSRLDEYTAEAIAAIHDGCGIVMPHAYDGTHGGEAADIRHLRAIGADGAQVNQSDLAVAALGEPVATDLVAEGDLPSPLPRLTSETLVNGLWRQGVARVPGGWVFTFNSALFRTDEDLKVVTINATAIPDDLAAEGYNHLGDPDQADGLLYVPLEQDDCSRDRQRVAVYDAISLAYLHSAEVELSHAAWLSVGDELAWSMDEFTGDELIAFSLPDFIPVRRLQLERPLARVQGGDLGPDGTLWLSTDDDRSTIYAVDPRSGRVRTIGSMGHLPGEGEGIDVTPLPSDLLHTMQVDPTFVSTWFQHWRADTTAATAPDPGEVCLVERSSRLGLPFQELELPGSPSPVRTGPDGCVPVPGATRDDPSSAARRRRPPATASDRVGRDVDVDDDDDRQPDKTAVPLARAHAHNDYEHPRPLRDALDHGFTSVEADV